MKFIECARAIPGTQLDSFLQAIPFFEPELTQVTDGMYSRTEDQPLWREWILRYEQPPALRPGLRLVAAYTAFSFTAEVESMVIPARATAFNTARSDAPTMSSLQPAPQTRWPLRLSWI